MGILPEAMPNYLARLGCQGTATTNSSRWNNSLEWFDLKDVSPSPSRMDLKKLYWINGEHIKITANEKLAEMVKPRPPARHPRKLRPAGRRVGIVKDRAQDLNTLSDLCLYYVKQTPAEADVQKHWDDEAAARMLRFAERLEGLEDRMPKPSTIFQTFLRRRRHQNGQTRYAPVRLAVWRYGENPKRRCRIGINRQRRSVGNGFVRKA